MDEKSVYILYEGHGSLVLFSILLDGGYEGTTESDTKFLSLCENGDFKSAAKLLREFGWKGEPVY